MKEKILEMLEIQESIDRGITGYTENDKLDVKSIVMALFDKLSGVNREMKPTWCYWEKSYKPIDSDKLKEELVGVWQFALTLHRLADGFQFDMDRLQHSRDLRKSLSWFSVLVWMPSRWQDALYDTIILTEKLGITFDEVYGLYVSKCKCLVTE